MTIIRGSRIFAAPCCGARYAFPNFVTMNFSAFEYWTDGWDDGILMPRDYGVRLCTCGRFVLRREMTEVGTADESDAPRMDYVSPGQIDACIAAADSREMELAARRYRWHELNRSYREQYRAHRDAEEASLRSAWEAKNPDRRSFWQRLAGRKPPVYMVGLQSQSASRRSTRRLSRSTTWRGYANFSSRKTLAGRRPAFCSCLSCTANSASLRMRSER